MRQYSSSPTEDAQTGQHGEKQLRQDAAQYHNGSLWEKEYHIFQSEMQSLKDELQLKEKRIEQLEQAVVSLKKELGNAAKESSKLYQESERNRHQLDKLRIDNKSMEMEIDKFRNERRVYYNKLNEIDSLKKEIGQELAEKNSLIEESNSKMKKLERSAGDMRVRMQELAGQLAEKEKENREYVIEIKRNLEVHLAQTNLINKLNYQLTDVTEINKAFKDKVYDLEKEKEVLLEKIAEEQGSSMSRGGDFDYPSSSTERSMLQIQSYMREIENVLDQRKEDKLRKQRVEDQLRTGIECLFRNL